MATITELTEKYPKLAEDLEAARQLQEQSTSLAAKAMYKQKQAEINGLIPKLIELAKVWNENELRYTITKIEILRDEIMSIENNSRALDTLVSQIEKGDFDNRNEDDE